jgi:hypothetical protein
MDETLEILEGREWAEAGFHSSLVSTCHRLWTKPVSKFTVEELRIMIGQGMGLPHLVPRALGLLERDPLAEGDCYPGDLLLSVMSAEAFLASHSDWLERLVDVAGIAASRLGEEDVDLRTEIVGFVNRHRPDQPHECKR